MSCAMQDAQHFDPVRQRPVENEIVLEAGNRGKANFGQGRMIGVVACSHAR